MQIFGNGVAVLRFTAAFGLLNFVGKRRRNKHLLPAAVDTPESCVEHEFIDDSEAASNEVF